MQMELTSSREYVSVPFFPLLPVGIFLLKVNYLKTKMICGICPKLSIKASEWRHWRRSDVFIINFEQISDVDLLFSLLTFKNQILAG